MATRRDPPVDDGSRSPTPQPSNNTTSSYRSDSTTGKPGIDNAKPKGSKGVAWADDKNVVLGDGRDQWTFYREPTPTPLDSDDYKQASQSTGIQNGAYSYNYSYDRVASPSPIPQVTVCGIRKRLFWILASVAVLVVIVAVGVGVGVGVVGAKQRSKTSDQDQFTTASGTSSSIPSTVTPTALARPIQATLGPCPAANNTRYTIPQVNKTFLRICGVDYTGQGGAVDLGVVLVASMQDCIISCAGYPNCTGCGWGVIPRDSGSDHRCWLKSDLQKSQTVRSGWDFAILQEPQR